MSLEYLVGHRVDNISIHLQGTGWSLLLEGGIKISYTSKGEKDAKPTLAVENTVIGVVDVTPKKYKIHFFSGSPAEEVEGLSLWKENVNIEYPEGMEPNIPKQVQMGDDLPPDPSMERLAEGPITA